MARREAYGVYYFSVEIHGMQEAHFPLVHGPVVGGRGSAGAGRGRQHH